MAGTFDEFRSEVVEMVERSGVGLVDPAAEWPAVLFLEIPDQGLVIAEMLSLIRMTSAAVSQEAKTDTSPHDSRATSRQAWVYVQTGPPPRAR